MIINVTNAGGHRIAFVPIPPHSVAMLDLADLEALIEMGCSLSWWKLNNIVRVCGRHSGDHLSVPRLILDAQPGQVVRHLNDDPLDLRRSNLVLVRGKSFKADRQHLTPPEKRRRRRIVISDDLLLAATADETAGLGL
jgi:hypothetical protein